MAIIDKIQISGTNYDIKDASATTVVNVTQAEYDDLVTGGTLDPTILYNITDATPIDISQYWTSAQTQSAITEATSGKLDTSVFQTYSGGVDTALANKVETSAITTAVTTASTDSEIPTAKAVNDAIEAGGGGGGGKAVSAGTNISITTGETADTINCTLPITISNSDNGTKQSIAIGDGSSAHISNFYDSIAIGKNSKGYFGSVVIGSNPTAYANNGDNVVIGNGTKFYNQSVVIGTYAEGYNEYNANSVVLGYYAKANNMKNAVAIGAEVRTTGTTKTNINNQLKIDASNQIYIMDKTNTNEICLQDYLGGGGGASYSAGTGIDITNDVISVTGMVATSAVTSAVTSGSTDVVTSGGVYDQLGGMKILHLTQAQYDALSPNYDNTTLYVITNS